MFETADIPRKRRRLEVSVRLAGGETVFGDMFAGPNERLSDLLNDERAFLPIDTGTDTVVVAKTQIAEVRSFDVPLHDDETDPYELLMVEPTVSDAELRAAWMERVKACHPDRLVALNLDPDIISAARRISQRINSAYDTIVRKRRSERGA